MSNSVTVARASVGQPAWLTLVRIVLGFILIWKGINFIRDFTALKSLIADTGVGIFSQNVNALSWW